MKEEWKFSHITTIGCKKAKQVEYYYSSEGRLKKIFYNGKIEISTPKKCGNNERIYITIAKLFPEICGKWYEGCQVDHINTNRYDNRAINLRVCSPKENMQNPITKQHCSDAAKKRWINGNYDNIDYTNYTPWNKGIKTGPLSEEHKQKIAKALKGKNVGKPSWNKGGTISEETKKKISEAHKGRHWFIGEDGKRHY